MICKRERTMRCETVDRSTALAGAGVGAGRRAHRAMMPVLIATLFWLVAPATANAGGVVIDDFSDTAGALLSGGVRRSAIGTQTVSDGPGVRDVLGGVRRLTLTASSLDMPGVDGITVRMVRKGTLLSYDSSVGASGQLRLDYDGGGAGLAADLSGRTGIALDFTAVDASVLPGLVSLTLADNSRSVTVAQQVVRASKQTVEFSLTSFSKLNLRKVRNISLTLTPSKAGDLQLGGIRTF